MATTNQTMAYINRLLLFICISISIPIQAQLENLADQLDMDNLSEELLENVIWLGNTPVNINEATIEELMLVPGFTPTIAARIIFYRQNYGEILSKFELPALTGMTKAQVDALLTYITIAPVPAQKKYRKGMSRGFILYQNNYQTPLSDGLSEHDSGMPLGQTMRFNIQQKGVYRFGFTTDHDAGEPFRRTNTKLLGPDYGSFFLSLENLPFTDRLLIGNYRVQHGQGLVFGGGFNLGKTLRTLPFSSDRGFTPFASATEFGFFSGLAFTASKGSNAISFYLSQARLDARFDSLSSTYLPVTPTGLYRTPSEMDRRKTLSQRSVGINYQRSVRFGKIGYNGLFHLKNNTGGFQSLYYNLIIKSAHLFGEHAIDISGNQAFLHGINLYPIHDLHIGFSYRNYSPFYENDFSNALAETAAGRNEQGFYIHLIASPKGLFTFSVYQDLFRFIEPRHQMLLPDDGYETNALLEVPLKRYHLLTLQYRYKTRNRDVSENTQLKALYTYHDHDWRIIFRSNYRKVQFTSRLQGGIYEGIGPAERGLVMVQDVAWDPRENLSLRWRAARFDTDFNTRQYVFESNIRYRFSIPAYQGNGIRTYLLAQWKYKSFTLSYRIALTRYDEVREVGSGFSSRSAKVFTDSNASLQWNF